MYIINTTFIIEPAVHGQWYDIFTRKFIPYLRENGFGVADGDSENQLIFTRVLTDNGDPHHTYSLQVEVPDTAEYQRFMQEIMGEYLTITKPIFEEQVLHFTSLLKKIEL